MTQHKINSARVERRYTALSLPLRDSMLNALQRHQDATRADSCPLHGPRTPLTMHAKELGMSEQERSMTRKEILDMIPVSSRVTDGKDPMRDLSIGGRRRRPEPRPTDEHERQLLSLFHIWMKHPTAVNPLETLSDLMLAHEIRAYDAMTKSASRNHQ